MFLHNQKAGGTSIASAMKTLYPSTDIAPVFDNSPGERDPSVWHQLRQFKYVGGHFGYEVRRHGLSAHHLITNFRDPVDRIYSLYGYWRNNVDYAAVQKLLPIENGPKYARSMNFSDFVRSESPYLSLYLDNFHTRQILHSGWLPRRISATDMFIAKWRVRSMTWFYVCEFEKSSFDWLSNTFPEIRNIPRENITRRTSSNLELPTEDDKDVIRARNWADLRLYRYAVKLLENRLKRGLF